MYIIYIMYINLHNVYYLCYFIYSTGYIHTYSIYIYICTHIVYTLLIESPSPQISKTSEIACSYFE